MSNGCVILPTPATLKKYGLSKKAWRALLASQGGVCYVCKAIPKSKRLVIDHEHVHGWKKMEPEKRRLYVRGLLCWRDNRYFLARGMTVKRALAVAEYLERYDHARTAAG